MSSRDHCNGRQLAQCRKGRITMRVSAVEATRNQVTRGFHAECTSCTSCCPPSGQANNPGPMESTRVLVLEKPDQLQDQ